MDQSVGEKSDKHSVSINLLSAGANHPGNCSESFTSSMIEQMFDGVNRVQLENQDSSLSVLDLDAIDDDQNLFMVGSTAPVSPAHLQSLASSLHAASPIPLSDNSAFLGAETPARIAKDVTFEVGNDRRGFSAQSTSLLNTKHIVSSTPFHKRSIPACFEDVDEIEATASKTYDLNDKNLANDTQSVQSHPINVTYDGLRPATSAQRAETHALNVTYNGPPRLSNATFTAGNDVMNDATFNKTSTEVLSNQTFEVVNALDKVPEKGPSSAELPATSPSSVEPLKDNLTSKKVESKDESQKRSLRKPLSALSNDNSSRIRPPSSKQSQKRLSRLITPRMNATTLTRIQANSPQQSSDDIQNENLSLFRKPPSQSIEKPKQVTKSKAAARRSLLPPPSIKLRSSTAAAASKPTVARNSLPSSTSNHTKQATSSKSASWRSKSETSLAKPVRNSVSAKLRTTSSSSLKPNASKLQKPQASSSRLRSSASSIESYGKENSKPRTRVPQPKPEKKKVSARKDQSSQCVVAMATLLDYVVNQVHGLTAPQLSTDKQRLLTLNEEQKQYVVDLSSRIEDMQQALDQSRAARDRDVRAAVENHMKKVKKIRDEYEAAQSKLEYELNEVKQEMLQQGNEHEKVLQSLHFDHRHAIEKIKTKHCEDIAAKEQEWEDRLQVEEEERNKLEDKMDDVVQRKVEELIQPYLNSYEEKESLKVVLEMKKNEQQKLMDELSRRCDQTDEARMLKNLVNSLQQKNEDLQMQINGRNTELRDIKRDKVELRRHLAEQQTLNQQLQCRVEELNYRLNSSSTPPLSPFNPVFTQSPTATKPPKFRGFAGALTLSDTNINAKGQNKMTSQSDDANDVIAQLPNL